MNDLHKDHRQRMDKKSEASGLHNMPEHEVLEKLLFAVIPRGNTNGIAKELCDKFGGIGRVLTADVNELMEVKGVGKRVAYFLKELPDVLGIVERSLNFYDDRILTSEDACNYVKTFFYGKLTEQFYLISLNSTGHIIKHTKIADGVTDSVLIDARLIAETAIRDKAHSVIIAHNHPGGTPNPSCSDVTCTENIVRALNTLGIKVFDSIIVAKGEGRSVFDSDLCGLLR